MSTTTRPTGPVLKFLTEVTRTLGTEHMVTDDALTSLRAAGQPTLSEDEIHAAVCRVVHQRM